MIISKTNLKRVSTINKMDLHNIISQPITDLKTLKSALETEAQFNLESIQRLALSSKPDDNYERLKLIGSNETIFNLLSKINKN